MKDFIQKIYDDSGLDLDMFGYNPDECDDSTPDSYIYAWFTDSQPQKCFYIGKGKRDRYNHILKEIQIFEENPKKYKGEKYKKLRDTFGISCRKLYENLTAKEAAILEAYLISEYLRKKEPLLNVILPSLVMEDDEIMEYRDSYFYEKDDAKFLSFYQSN